MTAANEAFQRLERAAESCRSNLAMLESAEGSEARWCEGVLIKDSESLLDAAESFFGQFGEIDEGPAADIATAGLAPSDMPTAIQYLSHATKACRRDLKVCMVTKDADALRKADIAYIANVKTLLVATENTARLAKVSKPKPAPAPAPKVAPIDNTKLVDQVFQSVTEFVSAELNKHAGKERETIERMLRDGLGDLKDSLRTREDVRELRELQAKGETDRRIADLGKSLSRMLDRRIEQTKAEAAKEAARHAAVKAREVKKELLARVEIHGDTAEIVAWAPRHEWRGTEIRFELEPGVWGPWTDVEGPRGRDGMNGGGGGVPRNLVLDGGGAFDEHTTLNGGTASTVNQFAVGGGTANTKYDARVFNGGRAI